MAPAEAAVAERLGFALPAEGTDAAARLAALHGAAGDRARRPTSIVGYASGGRVLVIGHAADAVPAAERLAGRLACTVLVPPAAATAPAPAGRTDIEIVHAAVHAVSGHLGAFEVTVRAGEETIAFAPSALTGDRPFDLVLDLGAEPRITVEVPPPGYYAPRRDAAALERALEELPELVGEFEKPRYFNYDPGICAHGRSGIRGCTRCLDACPTGAIRSLKELVEVNPHLCQGGGACATVCPTGAMTYAYPAPGDQIDALRGLLRRYREAGGRLPRVLFHDGGTGRAEIASRPGALPPRTIPCEVEEIGSVGLDAWLAALAFGAAGVDLLASGPVPASVRAALDEEIGFLDRILEGMGYPAGLVRVVPDAAALAAEPAAASPEFAPATFAGVDEKRTMLRLALDHLHAHAPAPRAEVALPAAAPFGEIRVDAEACTLCMACVGVCPAGALAAGGETPRLDFIEWNCVQCGLCERACPEDAITRAARFVYDRARREARRTLNEDAPFHCVTCGKAFGTTKVIGRMREKLASHWMFQKPEAVRRLEMCEDCRVRDMFKDGGGLLDS